MLPLEPGGQQLRQFIKAQHRIAGHAITPLISQALSWIIAVPKLPVKAAKPVMMG
jgi:hypothetical protein